MALAAVAREPVLRSEANVRVELPFTADGAYSDPFNEVTLDVIFIDPRGRKLRVPAFWAATNVWKVRYASPVVGLHRFRSECSVTRDRGLHGVTGKVHVKPYTGRNPLYAHGPLRVASNRRYLEHTDGAPFFWLGDTWWMGLCHRLHWPDEFQTLAAENARFGQTGPRVGSFDAGYGTSLLARLVGDKKAKEIWFLCRQYSAQEALDMGLVNAVVPLDQLEETAVQWAREILEKSPTAIRFIKAAFNAATEGLAGMQQFAGDATLLYYLSEEAKEGKNAFLEKRKPDFSKFPRFP